MSKAQRNTTAKVDEYDGWPPDAYFIPRLDIPRTPAVIEATLKINNALNDFERQWLRDGERVEIAAVGDQILNCVLEQISEDATINDLSMVINDYYHDVMSVAYGRGNNLRVVAHPGPPSIQVNKEFERINREYQKARIALEKNGTLTIIEGNNSVSARTAAENLSENIEDGIRQKPLPDMRADHEKNRLDGRIQVRTSKELAAKFDRAADELGMTKKDAIEQAISDWLIKKGLD
ncbi:MAG: ribbon-helix-helix domain-containing protein [Bryobacterales bacterium]